MKCEYLIYYYADFNEYEMLASTNYKLNSIKKVLKLKQELKNKYKYEDIIIKNFILLKTIKNKRSKKKWN